MKVSNVNQTNNMNFAKALVLKSTDARFINLLGDIDYFIFSRQKNPQARVLTVATSTRKNGYWTGKFLTGKDIQTPYAKNENELPSKVISSLDDILKMSAFKKIHTQVTDLYSKIFL